RQLSRETCHRALPFQPSSADQELRAGRGLGLVLRGRVVPRARAAGSRPARRAVSDATRVRNAEVWPELPLAAWNETRISLQLWTQMVGKTRLALAPMENHWWQVALYLTARGLTTSP